MVKKIKKEIWEQTASFEIEKALEFTEVIPITEDWKGKKILDFGCGSGRGSLKLANIKAIPYGLDILKSNIENSKKLLKHFKFKGHFKLINEKQNIPFTDNFFDGIVCDGVLHHIKHDDEVIEEFKRVLKPGGSIYLMLYTPTLFKIHLNTITNMIRNTPEKTWQRCFGELTDKCEYTTFYTYSDIMEQLMNKGFKSIKIAPFNHGQFMAVKAL